MAKKYFWLKLKDDFFNQKEIKMLRKLAGGDTFTVIYLKILLLSLKNDGRVYYDGIARNMVEEIALEIDEETENVQLTFNYLQTKGLLIFNSDDEVELSNIHQMIGSETAAASRMRKSRGKKEIEAECNNVTPELRQSYTEIEIEKEIEKEIENTKSDKSDSASIFTKFCNEVVDYLNQKAKSNFKATTKATQTKIRARLAEGFRVDDFKKVIDIKTAEWLDDANMSQYLRPETLFGTKFESYLNQKQAVKRVNAQNNWAKSPVKFEEMPNWNSRSTGSDPSRKAEIEKMMNEFFTDNEEEDK